MSRMMPGKDYEGAGRKIKGAEVRDLVGRGLQKIQGVDPKLGFSKFVSCSQRIGPGRF